MNPDSSSTEMSIKALQAQNAQFQELIMGLAQGQEELKALLLKKEKKKLEEAAGPKQEAGEKKKGKKGEAAPRGNAGARILLEKL